MLVSPQFRARIFLWWEIGMARAIASVVFAFLFGTMLGYFLLGWIGPMMAKRGWFPANALGVAVICGFAFACFVFVKESRRLARRRDMQNYAARSSMRYSVKGPSGVVDEIQWLIAYGTSWLENTMLKRVNDDVQMTVGDLSTRSSGDNARTRVRTVAHFQGDGLYFPHLTLQREGTLVTFIGDLAGVKDLDFAGHPEFSRAYHLSSDQPEVTTRLFDPSLLDYFAAHHGWEVRANRDQVMMTRDKLIAIEDLDEFIAESQEILTLLRRAGDKLIESAGDPEAPGGLPGIRAEQDASPSRRSAAAEPAIPPSHQATSASHRTGVEQSPFGALHRRIEAQQVDWHDVERFVQQPPPRDVPAMIRRQRAGCTGLFMLGFLSIWALMLIPFWVIAMVQNQKVPFGFLVMIGLFSLLPAIGIPLLVSRRHRAVAILRRGRRESAEIVDVRRTGVEVNSQRQYKVQFRYHACGEAHLKTLNVYGAQGELARDALDSGGETPVLVDPGDPDHCVLGIQLTNPVRVRL